MRSLPLALFWLFVIAYFPVTGQARMPDLERSHWPAEWITAPDADPEAYGVYYFRKSIDLPEGTDTFPVLISADNVYELRVNGKFAGRGPAKSDLDHWNYDRLDLAPLLRPGKNTLAVRVWNAGPYRQEAQITYRTGLILQGADPVAETVNTDTTWVARRDDSYRPIPISRSSRIPGMIDLQGYYVAGPGDRVDLAGRVTGWEMPDYDDGDWLAAAALVRGVPRHTVGMDAREPWRLLASVVPQMEVREERLATVRRAEGVEVPDGFPTGSEPLTVPARTRARVLLDQAYLTNAFPTLHLSGGEGALVVVTYAEALYEDDLRTKGNRDRIEGKTMVGRVDSIYTGGEGQQRFTPLSYRTYRYLQLEIVTADEPLVVADITAEAVGYPFERRAQLESPIAEIDTILDIGWRTARLCAMDTYMDCPYWEQLQYIGDTRIQALVSLYNTGDDRLVRNALNLMNYSRQPEGITLSRYPTNIRQIIAPFSLWYIGMLRDYMWYGDDPAFVREKLFGIRQVLDYFSDFQDADGSLRNVPNWAYSDWVNEWARGEPPRSEAGFSSVLDLQLLLAYQNARQLEQELGMAAFAEAYEEEIDRLSNTIRKKYWTADRGLFADTEDHASYSQHANALAILAGLVPEGDLAPLGRRMLSEEDLAPASIYFKYYLHQALTRAGLGDDYLDWLDIWRKNMDLGLTTWGEDSNVEDTRSDCHAWGSSPNIEFYRTILGIDSASPHFRTVRIQPHLGEIRRISGSMPHPAGEIVVVYDLDAGTGRVTLPEGIIGEFVWRGRVVELVGGENTLEM
ncbi:family 78 glycoside hydrolase catalytic domain [Lewinella sp. IMCC34191]|uniref:alpha-L-rhamnosidase-related protein n=1 Tax=Lewinella sp. IMCC34191 TaxID=2259172 RepID=UPI000E27BE96|nr:family 78 glycoside hydrolase catalytic domain [Lewinella sp. IMCC34191]